MKIIGIVAEYNPFHTGHAYQIAQSCLALGGDTGVVAVMSGNWVQQAHCAIADKWTRARLALMGGADLVLELPTVWATASAEGFARGAVSLLHGSGVVDTLSFGSELGEVAPLHRLAEGLDRPEYRDRLAVHLNGNLSFPAARQKAMEDLLGGDSALLSTPNNNLGIEYLRALNSMSSHITPMTVRRQGAAHNTISTDAPTFVSATHIRHNLTAGTPEAIRSYLGGAGAELLLDGSVQLAFLDRAERAILAKLRSMTASDWAKLPDSGQAEGLPQRLEKAGKQCTSVAHFLELTKTKRYTHARLRRLVLWAYLGLQAEHIPAAPPYLRVLGFNRRGRDILKSMKQNAALPILTKPAHARTLDEPGRTLFEQEARFTDLYDLCLDEIPVPGREWTQGPVLLLD